MLPTAVVMIISFLLCKCRPEYVRSETTASSLAVSWRATCRRLWHEASNHQTDRGPQRNRPRLQRPLADLALPPNVQSSPSTSSGTASFHSTSPRPAGWVVNYLYISDPQIHRAYYSSSGAYIVERPQQTRDKDHSLPRDDLQRLAITYV